MRGQEGWGKGRRGGGSTRSAGITTAEVESADLHVFFILYGKDLVTIGTHHTVYSASATVAVVEVNEGMG